tara:strand:+ start:192 stop:449 length:258 start_codon:yes stop_codon:yes gene_type:complete
MNQSIDDYQDIVDFADSDPRAIGTTVYWISSRTTYGLGDVIVIVDTDEQASAYSDISMELYGHPNRIDIMGDSSRIRDATDKTRI